MKNITIIITILSTVFKLSAQDENNLVLNPSFESVDGKLKKLTQIYLANDWDSPTALKADLFSSSISGDILYLEIYMEEFQKMVKITLVF